MPKKKVLVCWSQVQMKQTNTDFRGLITNRDVQMPLPILHDWLLSPERQPCPIEINRIFAVGFPGTKISFPIIHHLILGMSFTNWFTANLQEKLPLLKNVLSFFYFLFSPPFFSTGFTFSNSSFTKGIHFPLGFLSCFVLLGGFLLFLYFTTYHNVGNGPSRHDCFRRGCGKLRIYVVVLNFITPPHILKALRHALTWNS